MSPVEVSSRGKLETHPYVGVEPKDLRHMLDTIGVKSIDELFSELPAHLQNPDFLLSPPFSEMELKRKFGELASKNTRIDGSDGVASFLGGANALHFVPAVVGEIMSWGQFLTAYTAYQAEVSQGTLETAFDYESYVCELNGMEVSNTGMYDGASAMAEGALMAAAITNRKKVMVDSAVDPKMIEVVKTYCYGKDIEVLVTEPGQKTELDNETAAYLVQTPNYLGTVEDLEEIQQAADAVGAKTVVSADQLSLALFKSPGEYGADIVVGEAQSLGNMPNFGGPNLGVFTTKEKYVRKMPGRIVGQGKDIEGKTAYTLILQPREQHIRREKATSNICTSQQLVALGMTVYMSLAGQDGLQEIARQNYYKAHYAADQLQNIAGISLSEPDEVFFSRFVIKSPIPAEALSKRLLEDYRILSEDVSAVVENGIALTFTEMSTKEQIDQLVSTITEISEKYNWVDPENKKLSGHVKRSESSSTKSKTPLRMGFTIPSLDVPEYELPSNDMLRQTLDIPEGQSELAIIRRYKKLADKNFGIETGSYPLGSCTMKLNPKINDTIASDAGFAATHPEQPEALVQGNLQVIWELQKALSEISGMHATATTPMAGAQGELAGILIAKKYFEELGEDRHKVLIPDSAHGTNPATAAMAGFEVVEVASDKDGNIDMADFKSKLGPDVACMMLTYPSTLGLPDTNVEEIARLLHTQGALLYGDGANMNALVGRLKPGDAGFDIMHFNLHKTFSTPHGGGGPGASAVSVKGIFESFLPTPVVRLNVENADGNKYEFIKPENSIGRMGGAYGNFANLVRALVYINALGKEGLNLISDIAVLNANYLQARLKKEICHIPHGDRNSMHEFIVSVAEFKKNGLHAVDFAKALIDAGFHPPTINFPLIVDEAMMFEPTEAETLPDLDKLVEAIEKIWTQAEADPGKLKEAPVTAPIRRIGQAEADRNPVFHHDWNKPAA